MGDGMRDITITSDGCTVLARRCTSRETVQMGLVEKPEGVLVVCRTEGDTTLDVYDAPWHVGCACVTAQNLPALIEVLAGPLPSVEKTLPALLTALFADDEVQFSDLLDILDAAKVPYAYRAFGPDATAFRFEGDEALMGALFE